MARPMCADGRAAERRAGAGAGVEAAGGTLTPEEMKRASRLRPMAAAGEGRVRVSNRSWARGQGFGDDAEEEVEEGARIASAMGGEGGQAELRWWLAVGFGATRAVRCGRQPVQIRYVGWLQRLAHLNCLRRLTHPLILGPQFKTCVFRGKTKQKHLPFFLKILDTHIPTGADPYEYTRGHLSLYA
jgi:hypothetical protein